MQAANFTPEASLEGRAGAGWAARNELLAAARYWLHGPLPPWTSPDNASEAPMGMVMLIPQCTSMVGSVWSGSPWLRMQAAHATSSPVALPFDLVFAELSPLVPPLVPLVVRVRVVVMFATEGDFEPPHPASPAAAVAARRASPPDRRYTRLMRRLP